MRLNLCWLALLPCSITTAHAQIPSANQGQAFPDRPLRIIVAFTTGTAADIVARQLAAKLTDDFGKPVIVENRDGAAGTIGAGLAARATPDGQTMLIASLSGFEAASWYGIVVPTQTPKPVIAKLHASINKALREADVRQRFLSLGGDIVAGGPAELDKAMRGGTAKWGSLVKEIEAQER